MFSIDEAAHGHRVWIQLALLQAIDVLRHRTNHLLSMALEALDATEAFDDVDEMVYEVALAARRYLDAVDAFRRGEAWSSDIAAHELMPIAPVLRKPLFVIDEPEQHLHPQAQRSLAIWLRDLTAAHSTQAVLITHSVPFIKHADALAVVSREPPATASVSAYRPEELTALSSIAHELGLDRGELLGAISVFLFVEGDSDQYVLEGLFGERLRRIGVAVFPVRGATQLAQIVDAQVLTPLNRRGRSDG